MVIVVVVVVVVVVVDDVEVDVVVVVVVVAAVVVVDRRDPEKRVTHALSACIRRFRHQVAAVLRRRPLNHLHLPPPPPQHHLPLHHDERGKNDRHIRG